MIVQWYWRLLATDERELAFTNQLFGEDNRRRGQVDDVGFSHLYWPAGTSGITTFEIDIDPAAPTGAYWLHVAMHERGSQDFSNLPVFDEQGNRAGNRLSYWDLSRCTAGRRLHLPRACFQARRCRIIPCRPPSPIRLIS